MNSESKDPEYYPVFYDFARAQKAHHLHKKKQRKLARRERAIFAELKKEQLCDDELYFSEIRELRETWDFEVSERKAASAIQDATDEAENKAYMERIQESFDTENRFSNLMEDWSVEFEAKNNAVLAAKEIERFNMANHTPEEVRKNGLEKIAHDVFEDKMMENIFGLNWLLD
jgi:L-arabinose isomerase